MKLNTAEASALARRLREVAVVLRAAGLYLCAGVAVAAADFIDDIVTAWGNGETFAAMARDGGTGDV